VGEWVIAFTTSNATITTPGGQSITVIVSQTGPYMVFNAPDGKKTYVLWQITQDAVTDFLSVCIRASFCLFLLFYSCFSLYHLLLDLFAFLCF
jgi:hypothetical protein